MLKKFNEAASFVFALVKGIVTGAVAGIIGSGIIVGMFFLVKFFFGIF